MEFNWRKAMGFHCMEITIDCTNNGHTSRNRDATHWFVDDQFVASRSHFGHRHLGSLEPEVTLFCVSLHNCIVYSVYMLTGERPGVEILDCINNGPSSVYQRIL